MHPEFVGVSQLIKQRFFLKAADIRSRQHLI